jgi:hypothetical protein
MAKNWVKPESQFASGSPGRVSANLTAQREQADKAAEDVGRQQRQANPRSRADKTVTRRGGGG